LLQGAFHDIDGEETIAALSKQSRQDSYRTSNFERIHVPIARKRGKRNGTLLALIIPMRVSIRISARGVDILEDVVRDMQAGKLLICAFSAT